MNQIGFRCARAPRRGPRPPATPSLVVPDFRTDDAAPTVARPSRLGPPPPRAPRPRPRVFERRPGRATAASRRSLKSLACMAPCTQSLSAGQNPFVKSHSQEIRRDVAARCGFNAFQWDQRHVGMAIHTSLSPGFRKSNAGGAFIGIEAGDRDLDFFPGKTANLAPAIGDKGTARIAPSRPRPNPAATARDRRANRFNPSRAALAFDPQFAEIGDELGRVLVMQAD